MRADTTRLVSHDPFLPQPEASNSAEGGAPSRTPPTPGRYLVWGLLMWGVLTMGALFLAWSWPDATLLHFWLVAQAVPVLYWLLMVWVIRSPSGEDHVA